MPKSHGAFRYLLQFLLCLSMITNFKQYALIFGKFLFILFIKLKESKLLICSEGRKNAIQNTLLLTYEGFYPSLAQNHI